MLVLVLLLTVPLVQSSSSASTVEGELGVAKYINNFFKRAPLPDTCGYVPLPDYTPRYRC